MALRTGLTVKTAVETTEDTKVVRVGFDTTRGVFKVYNYEGNNDQVLQFTDFVLFPTNLTLHYQYSLIDESLPKTNPKRVIGTKLVTPEVYWNYREALYAVASKSAEDLRKGKYEGIDVTPEAKLQATWSNKAFGVIFIPKAKLKIGPTQYEELENVVLESATYSFNTRQAGDYKAGYELERRSVLKQISQHQKHEQKVNGVMPHMFAYPVKVSMSEDQIYVGYTAPGTAPTPYHKVSLDVDLSFKETEELAAVLDDWYEKDSEGKTKIEKFEEQQMELLSTGLISNHTELKLVKIKQEIEDAKEEVKNRDKISMTEAMSIAADCKAIEDNHNPNKLVAAMDDFESSDLQHKMLENVEKELKKATASK